MKISTHLIAALLVVTFLANAPAQWSHKAGDPEPHSPGQTIVEGVFKGGKIESIRVTPESRAKDIVNWLDKVTPYEPPNPADTSVEQPKPPALPAK